MEELARQAGWAKTFGLPLELVSAERAQELFPPMSTDGVLGAAYLPTDGYIDPSQLTFALAEGARRARRRDRHEHARDGDRRRARPRHRRRDRPRARSRREIVVNAGGMFAREIGALAGVERAGRADGARVPRDAADGRAARRPDDARPEPARLLPRRVRRARHGRLRAQPGAVGARRDPGGLQREAPPRGLGALRGAPDRTRSSACPSLEEREVVRLINGPEAFTPDGEFILGRVGRTRLLGRRRVLRARSRRRRRAWASSWPSGSCEGSPSLDTWEMDSRRFGAALREPRVHARAHGRGLRDLLRRQVPGPGAAGRPAAPRLPRLRAAARARRLLRGEVRLGAGELVRVERRGRRRVAAPARLGREDLVARDRRRAPSRAARRRRSSTRRRSRSSTSSGPGAAGLPRGPRARTASRARSARSRTRRCSIRAAGSSATSP